MQNFWILAEAAPTEAPATASAAAPGTAPAASAGGTTPAPSKEVQGQPLDESGTAISTSASTSTQANGSAVQKAGDEKPPVGPNPMWNILFIVVIFVVMYFMFIRGPKKQQQQQQEMIRSLQKNDRVRTVGGIIGTVVDVKDEYVTLKIDEASNTKIRVVPQAISKNLAPDIKD